MSISRLLELHGLAKQESRKYDRKLVFGHSSAPEKARLPLFLLGYLS